MTKQAFTVRIAVVLALAATAFVAPLQSSITMQPAEAAASAEAAEAAATRIHRGTAVGAQFHGTWANMSDRERVRVLDMMVAAGATWVRIDVGWTTLQPYRRGSYDMRWGVPFVDKVLNMAHARGLKVLAMVWQTPGWANGHRAERVMPRNVSDYAAVMRFASRRWSKQVQAWQVWNEPNSRIFLSPPDPGSYTRLLQAGYRGVKAGNRRAKVVFGGTMYIDTRWIARAYSAGAKGSFDVMAVHAYQGNSSKGPEAADRDDAYRMIHTGALVNLMRRNGDGHKKIWFTEFGWSTNTTKRYTRIWEQGVSEPVQARYLVRTLIMLRKRFPQVTTVFWYNSHDRSSGTDSARHQGLLRSNYSPKPAWYALRCYMKKVCR